MAAHQIFKEDSIEGFYVIKEKHGVNKALDYFHRAAGGDVEAVTEIANCFYDSFENELAFQWLKNAADLGNPDAMVLLSDYYSGRLEGTDVDMEMADYYMQKAIDLKSPKAFLKLASRHYSEDDLSENQIAFDYYMKAAELNDPEGQAEVGIAYLNGVGVERNLQEAFRWLSMSTDYRNAAFPLAQCYLEGLGTSVDYEKATEYLERAVDAKCIEKNRARRKLIELYDNGYGGDQRYAKKSRVESDLEASDKLLKDLAASVLNS